MRNSLPVRAKLIFLGICCFSVGIVAKIINIQFVNKEKWEKLVQDKFFVIKEIPAMRGNILSDSGDLLATSLPFYNIAIDPSVIDEQVFYANINELSDNLANFFHTHDAAYYHKLLLDAKRQNKKYLHLHERRITHIERQQIFSWPIFKLGRYKGGLILEKETKRFYPFKHLARRTIGYVQDDRKVGLEQAYDEILAGTNGEALYQKIIGNDYKVVNNEANQKPIDGLDIVTTLNVNLQDVAHSSLLEILKKCEGNYGVAIVMEVKTGDIKAMVNLKRGEDGEYRESYNYALGGLGCVEPGSVIKAVSMMALLEEGEIKLDDIVETGRGSYKFHSLVMHDINPAGYGPITVQTAFEKSSNIGIAKLVNSKFHNNPQRFLEFFHKLKLDESLNMGIAGEGKPFFNNPKLKQWSKDSLPWMSIGYEMKLSPLQILTFYNAIANDGVMLKPRLVSEVRQGLSTVKKFDTEVLCKEICSKDTLEKIRTLLEGVVLRGTAQKFKHGFYQIAGKSGTVNKLKNGMYTTDTCVNFAGYFPANNPRYSCIVTVDEPKGAEYHFGSQVGAPVVKAIANNISSMDLKSAETVTLPKISLKNNKIFNKKDLLCAGEEFGFDVGPVKNINSEFVQKNSNGWQGVNISTGKKIPNFSNMCLKDVLTILLEKNIKFEIEGNLHGKVVSQVLKAEEGKEEVLTIVMK